MADIFIAVSWIVFLAIAIIGVSESDSEKAKKNLDTFIQQSNDSWNRRHHGKL